MTSGYNGRYEIKTTTDRPLEKGHKDEKRQGVLSK
jgi:hypothetical protein